MKTSRSPTLQILKNLYLPELVFIADRLSQDRKKWTYDKRSKSSVIRAITSNVKEEQLLCALEESCGKRMPSGDTFPDVFQFQHIVFGPLGFLNSSVERNRYDVDTITEILTKYMEGENLLETLVSSFRDKIPKEIFESVTNKDRIHKDSALKQLVLAYSSDKEICYLANELLAKERLKINVEDFYENIEYPWIITRYGIALEPKGEPINNLVNLVRKHYEEADLEPELKRYSGDFPTRLLEYCIIESPETILRRFFGTPELRKIAKKFGFVTGNIESADEIVALTLLGLGFGVPPTLAGITAYLNSLQKFKRDLSESRDVGWRSGIMSRAFVEMEKVLRDLAHFYIAFLWSEQLDDIRDDIEKRMKGLTSRRIEIKALDVLVGKRFRIKKPIERSGFGDFIALIKIANNTSQKGKSLKKKMAESFGRKCILESKEIKLIDSISPYRASFAHTKDYPGDEKNATKLSN
jgi:hypothetical protein